MLRHAVSALGVFLACLGGASGQTTHLKWDELPPLPPAAGQTRQPGVASPFVGVHGDVLIVAGGANFPDRMPWEGGAKVWWDDIWVLEQPAGGPARWVTDKTFRLPRPIGYGVSVSTPAGVVCAGGSDAEQCYADVFMLTWDADAREIRTTMLPSLPEPLANMAGALVGTTFYLAGGQHVIKGAMATTVFWALDLSKRERPLEFKWRLLPAWPGPPRVLPVAAGQRGANGEEFFLFGGRLPQPGQRTRVLTDAYAYDPTARSWRALAAVGHGDGVSVMAGTAAAVGDSEIFIWGGDRGEQFLELESLDLAIESLRRGHGAGAVAERASFEAKIAEKMAAKRTIYESHPGFGREVFAYHTQRDTWRVGATAPAATSPQVTTTAVVWGDAIVIPSGEIRPGVRTPAVVRVTPQR